MFKFLNRGKKKATERSNKWLFGVMLVFGVAGLISAFDLSVERIHLLEHPDAVLTCSINLVLNCATVMQTWQASLFGFPNPYIGLMAYPVVITVAVAGLSGVQFKRWFLIVANICYGLGAIFAYWLFFSSVYVIQVLCPWCLVVTFSTTLIFASLTHLNLRENTFRFSESINKKIQELMARDVGKIATAAWIVLMIALVLIKFGDSLFL
ncbi:MAG TPA: vitamin K epoxide reductase family protein [Candidatus Saccharimonadales bacterium]|nr:vitamin K epoxide reductase family protein [Candidatus Saccharimonadales bacterium]